MSELVTDWRHDRRREIRIVRVKNISSCFVKTKQRVDHVARNICDKNLSSR